MLVPITVFDIIDIVLVAFILFQVYRVIRGTAAFNISIVIFLIYIFWLVVKALDMELVSSLLGQVIGVGVIALIIVFQQEVRRFLLVLGNRYVRSERFSIFKIFKSVKEESDGIETVEILTTACASLASKKTGALIVVGRQSSLSIYADNGELLRAKISSDLLETIFFKNTPLHDGAVLIEDNLIIAARCPLPVTDQISLPTHFGMRHRAAVGISEQTDALVIVISEESGKISVAEGGEVREGVSQSELRNILLAEKVW